MRFLITETNDVKELTLICAKNNICYVADFIGNSGALDNENEFLWDDEQEIYTCDEETFNWWSRIVDAQKMLDERIELLKQEHDSDLIYKIIWDSGAYNDDLEYQASCAMQALDDAFN